MGTRLSATIIRIVDADTMICLVEGKPETIRLLYTDTEESKPKLKSKPITNAGILAYEFALFYWDSFQPIVEFESGEPLSKCLIEERDYFGRLRCYLWRDDQNYNLKLVELGLSPYFKKYGSSVYLNEQFTLAQESAQFNQAGIWNPSSDPEVIAPNYLKLVPHWNQRAAIIDQWRVSEVLGIWDCTKNCDNVCRYIRESRSAPKNLSSVEKKNYGREIIFCDLQSTNIRRFSIASIYRVGWKSSYISLVVESATINQLIEEKYIGYGQGYAYVSGIPEWYRGRSQLRVLEVANHPSKFTDINPVEILPSERKRSLSSAIIQKSVRKFKNARDL